MTRLALLPFFSQQNKLTGKFLLHSCVATKQAVFIGKKMLELGWDVRLILPMVDDCETEPEFGELDDSAFGTCEIPIPADNFAQRLTWPVLEWRDVFEDVDILFTSHELIGWAIKGAYPKLKVIQQHNLLPETAWPWMAPLFDLNYMAVDLITVLTPVVKHIIEAKPGVAPVRIWPFGWDAELLKRAEKVEKDIDLLFVLRGSSTNYSHHIEFIEAIKLLRAGGWNGMVVFPDHTRYLRQTNALAGLKSVYVLDGDAGNFTDSYLRLLRRSKAVIGLCDTNGWGGQSVREAIACDAFPILLDCPAYRALVPADWPGLIPSLDPGAIAETIATVTEEGWGSATRLQISYLWNRMMAEEYQSVWEHHIKPDLQRLLAG